jgi:glutamate dehydrogenase (NAD(P)+)
MRALYRRLPEDVRRCLRPLNLVDEMASFLPGGPRAGLHAGTEATRRVTRLARIRYPLRRLVGPCQGSGERLVCLLAMDDLSARYWSSTLFAAGPVEEALGDIPVLRIPAAARRLAGGADLSLWQTPWPVSRLAGGPMVPSWLPLWLATDRPLEQVIAGDRSGRSARKNEVRRVQRLGLTVRVTTDAREYDAFRRDLYEPYVRQRFGELLVALPRQVFTHARRNGWLLLMEHEGRPVGGAVIEVWGDDPRVLVFGVEPNGPIPAGTLLEACYYHAIRRAPHHLGRVPAALPQHARRAGGTHRGTAGPPVRRRTAHRGGRGTRRGGRRRARPRAAHRGARAARGGLPGRGLGHGDARRRPATLDAPHRPSGRGLARRGGRGMIAPAIASIAEERTAPEPRLLWQVKGREGLLGALVVDELVAARACGGIRMAPTVTVSELRDLAGVMTLKFAFFGIACGGAKAGVIVPAGAGAEEREARTRAFGAALAPLVRFGTYIPGTDLGCSERDLWDVLAGAGLGAGSPPERTLVETSATARYSGQSAAIAALAALGDRAGGATLSVLGYGRVGAALAARFTAAGGRLIGISTARGAVIDPDGLDVDRLELARAHHGEDAPLHYRGGQRVGPDDVLGLAVDVLAPCATTRMLDGTSWRRARCRIVSPGANAAVTPDAEAGLQAAGVMVVPDFVANAGGILASHFWPLELPPTAVHLLLEYRFRAIVDMLLARAAQEGAAPADVARRLARQSLARLTADHGAAVRHERLIARLARSRVRRVVPDAVVTLLVAHVARQLGPTLA